MDPGADMNDYGSKSFLPLLNACPNVDENMNGNSPGVGEGMAVGDGGMGESPH
jgi:hypothetical protein